jgi:hypothetical protein
MSAALRRVQLQEPWQLSWTSTLRLEEDTERRERDMARQIRLSRSWSSSPLRSLHLCSAALSIGDDRDSLVQLNVKTARVINSVVLYHRES